MFPGCPSGRPLSVNTYFAWCDFSQVTGRISVKRDTNIRHVRGLCWKDFQGRVVKGQGHICTSVWMLRRRRRTFRLCDNEADILSLIKTLAARLITGTRRRGRSPPYYATPLNNRYPSESVSISKWRAWFASRCPVRAGALYLADDCCLVSDSTRRSLQSDDVPTCVEPRTLGSYGDRTFAATGPRLWNSLPVQLRNPDITYGRFRRSDTFWQAWTRRSVTSDMRHFGKPLT